LELSAFSRKRLVGILLDLPQALGALQATNFHVSPELIEVLLTNDAERRRAL
jgi:hypothetical protein